MTIDWQKLKRLELSKKTSIIIVVVFVGLIFGIGTYKIYRSANPAVPSADEAKQAGLRQAKGLEAFSKARSAGSVKTPAPIAPIKR